jgi:hypothetical protein
MQSISDVIREKNIHLDSIDESMRFGFTQVPNFILRDPNLSIGAKLTYAMFLSYAWNNDFCFPGQERLAADMGMSVPSVSKFISELAAYSLVTVQRRGLGKTNLYTVHSRVRTTQRDPTRRVQTFTG